MADLKQAVIWLAEGKKIRPSGYKCGYYRYLCPKTMVFKDSENLNDQHFWSWEGDWELYEEPKLIPPPQYDPREVQLRNSLEDEGEYIVWSKCGTRRSFAFWDADDKCFYSLCDLNTFPLDVHKWEKLPEMPK